jgi:hypothetical protein
MQVLLDQFLPARVVPQHEAGPRILHEKTRRTLQKVIRPGSQQSRKRNSVHQGISK